MRVGAGCAVEGSHGRFCGRKEAESRSATAIIAGNEVVVTAYQQLAIMSTITRLRQ